MSSGFRERMRDERGLISAGALIGIGILLFIAYLLLAAFEGDSAQFGRLGGARFQLRKGFRKRLAAFPEDCRHLDQVLVWPDLEFIHLVDRRLAVVQDLVEVHDRTVYVFPVDGCRERLVENLEVPELGLVGFVFLTANLVANFRVSGLHQADEKRNAVPHLKRLLGQQTEEVGHAREHAIEEAVEDRRFRVGHVLLRCRRSALGPQNDAKRRTAHASL